MDPVLMVYLLIAVMAASGGVMGAFWVRALTNMRRHAVDSAEALKRLAEMVGSLQREIDDLRRENVQIVERLDLAERRLKGGD